MFLNATATEWNLPQRRKCAFFQFPRSLSEEKARSSRLKFMLESILEVVQAIAFSSKLLSFGSMLFTGFSDGAVEVHSLGYCTVVFLRAIPCEWT